MPVMGREVQEVFRKPGYDPDLLIRIDELTAGSPMPSTIDSCFRAGIA
jgi:hypothetical protein